MNASGQYPIHPLMDCVVWDFQRALYDDIYDTSSE
jgi:hypothetical protein